jgi:hypothetical protein
MIRPLWRYGDKFSANCCKGLAGLIDSGWEGRKTMRDATPNPVSFLRKQETKHRLAPAASWVPAFAGMTPVGGEKVGGSSPVEFWEKRAGESQAGAPDSPHPAPLRRCAPSSAPSPRGGGSPGARHRAYLAVPIHSVIPAKAGISVCRLCSRHCGAEQGVARPVHCAHLKRSQQRFPPTRE